MRSSEFPEPATDSPADPRGWLPHCMLHLVRCQDAELYRHMTAPAGLASRVAEQLDADHEVRITSLTAYLLHDIGKLGIDRASYQHPRPLADHEWVEITRHPHLGAGLVARVPGMGEVSRSIGSHHEHWDGSGYPLGLRGEEIPLGARVVAVVDAFDAMTTPRPYRSQRSVTDAVRELEQQAGRQFDPAAVSALTRALGMPR